jgi:hypothetical protein
VRPAGPSAAPVPSVTATSPTATERFCAYGGVGLVPNPLPPGYETEFGVIVTELDNPGPPIAGVRVRGAALLDGAGAPLASMKRLDHLVVLTDLQAPGPTLGIFAVYLNPQGTPFSGTLPSGRTILRVRFSMEREPLSLPARCRLELDGLGASPLVVEGAPNGSWPT